MVALATNIKKANKQLTIDDLIRMYESDGITPDFLLEAGAIESIPASFYTKPQRYTLNTLLLRVKTQLALTVSHQLGYYIMRTNRHVNLRPQS